MTEILRRLADPQQQVRLFQSVPMPFECTPEEVAEALQSRTEDSPKAQASARWVALWDKAVQESRMGDVAQVCASCTLCMCACAFLTPVFCVHPMETARPFWPICTY